jgi:hypothetical protein
MTDMKITLLICLTLSVATATVSAASEAGFTVHEWGTFTTVSAPDGTLLTGLEREEERLPNFVRSHAGFAPAEKGWVRPVANVTVKMETPVIYFYSDHELPVRVEVGFVGGSISQWYPERSGGEEFSERASPGADLRSLRNSRPVDFARGFSGRIVWDVVVLAPMTAERITAPSAWETPQWPRARVSGANLVRGPLGVGESDAKGTLAEIPVVEGFLFYRGIGNFALPLRVYFDEAARLVVSNEGAEALPFVWVYDNRTEGAAARYHWCGLLKAKEAQALVPKMGDAPSEKQLFARALVEAGLAESEARAMLATWQESYFDAEGLRVFWIVPRAFTDRVLPLSITPNPKKLERVLVGRSEVITPEFAAMLESEFRGDGGVRWRNHRYGLAYRELAARRGVALSATGSIDLVP